MGPEDFAYQLPDAAIAQVPLEDRPAARLLDAVGDSVVHRTVRDLPSLLGPGDLPETDDGPCTLPGVVAPHAGYQFSGPVAAHTYKVLAESGTPETVVILGPNHTGFGSAVATMTNGAWRTPLGSVEIDSEFATALVRKCGVMDDDLRERLEAEVKAIVDDATTYALQAPYPSGEEAAYPVFETA
jgi:hypothetical protein